MTAPSSPRRSLAFIVDGAIALLLFAAGWVGGVLAVAYLVFRDGLGSGQSLGKRLLSLRVIKRDTEAGIGFMDSLKRNLVFVIPLLHAAISATVFEGVVWFFDEEGLRLGDRIAGTRVMRLGP